jgi:hypothetical protein
MATKRKPAQAHQSNAAVAVNPVTTTWKQIGVVCVDTGCISIGDPCRLVDLEYGEMFPEGSSLHRQIEQLAHGNPGDEMIPSVVTLRTGIGDGDYPVMAMIEDGMVKTVVIEFLSDDFVKALRKHIAKENKGGSPP